MPLQRLYFGGAVPGAAVARDLHEQGSSALNAAAFVQHTNGCLASLAAQAGLAPDVLDGLKGDIFDELKRFLANASMFLHEGVNVAAYFYKLEEVALAAARAAGFGGPQLEAYVEARDEADTSDYLSEQLEPHHDLRRMEAGLRDFIALVVSDAAALANTRRDAAAAAERARRQAQNQRAEPFAE